MLVSEPAPLVILLVKNIAQAPGGEPGFITEEKYAIIEAWQSKDEIVMNSEESTEGGCAF